MNTIFNFASNHMILQIFMNLGEEWLNRKAVM